MKFRQALDLMKQGTAVKRPHWSGYWKIENGTVMMYCKDGRVLDIRNPDDVIYTLENIAAEDWEIAQ